MFGSGFAGVADEQLIAAIVADARQESRLAARQSAAIAELISRHCADTDDDERAWWACDPWEGWPLSWPPR